MSLPVNSLFFSRGAELADPTGLLRGTRKGIRHIVLTDIALFDDPAVEALIAESLARATPPIDPAKPGRLIVKSVSADSGRAGRAFDPATNITPSPLSLH